AGHVPGSLKHCPTWWNTSDGKLSAAHQACCRRLILNSYPVTSGLPWLLRWCAHGRPDAILRITSANSDACYPEAASAAPSTSSTSSDAASSASAASTAVAASVRDQPITATTPRPTSSRASSTTPATP